MILNPFFQIIYLLKEIENYISASNLIKPDHGSAHKERFTSYLWERIKGSSFNHIGCGFIIFEIACIYSQNMNNERKRIFKSLQMQLPVSTDRVTWQPLRYHHRGFCIY